MGKQKEITYNQLNQIKPVTDSQKLVFDTWKQGQNQFLFGCAGTGKTFVSLYPVSYTHLTLPTNA